MGQVVWFTNDRKLMVQFKGIGEHNHFTAVLEDFKALFKPRWSPEIRRWELSIEEFPKLVRFADGRKLRLISANPGESPSQLSLF